MRYDRIYKAKFIERPNRFIAYAELNGKKETVHVKNTGRCAELLRPGADIYIQESDNPSRKTRWDLIAVKKGSRMINMDSQIPNKVVKEWIEQGNLFGNVTLIRPETVYKNSFSLGFFGLPKNSSGSASSTICPSSMKITLDATSFANPIS